MIAYVQSATHSSSTVLSTSTTFSVNVTAGNFLIAAVHIFNNSGGPGTITVTDSLGNTWTQAPGGLAGFGSFGWDQIWYCPNCLGGADTVTVTCTTNGFANYPALAVLEYSGVANSFPVETDVSASGSGTAVNSGNLTTANASDLLIGLEDNVTAGTTFTAAGGWTMRQTGGGGNVAEHIVAPGTYSYSGTESSSVNWGASVVAFKAAAAGASSAKPVVCIMQ